MKDLTPQLLRSLKHYSRQDFIKDVTAGVIVAIIALPLSIALALASGVAPEQGLYTAIVAGFLISALGGSKVQIAGPTAAFATIVAGIVARNGMEGLAVATILAGLMLIILGLLRLGSMIKFIPYTITTGFTAGIAVTIVIGQLKDFFGLTFTHAPVETMEKLGEAARSFGTVNITAAAVGCLALSFYLLYDYTVGKMFLAAFLHMAGVYFLLQINGRLLKKLLMFRKKVYFRHLLWWNDLLYECRLNGNIIFAIYGVNFVLVFLFGGMFASDFPEDPVYTVVQVLTGVIGLSVLLEEQAFILEKMILDLQKEKERWDILFQIGMEWETWRRLVQNKLKMIVIIPMAAASVMGAVFFFCDYVYQADVTTFDGMWSAVLLKYTGAVVLFWLLQYGGYLLINRRLLRKYYVWQETLQE